MSEVLLSSPSSEVLPVKKNRLEIEKTFLGNSTTLIIAKPGSGKTTLTPPILREALGPNSRVLITQPRQLAAISVANFVSQSEGVELGKEVGYVVRFDDKSSEGTHTNFVTDGVFLRMLQNDPLLSKYDALMLDEVHEGSINIYLALGMAKKVQADRKRLGLKELKIVVASATLEKEKLQKYFGNPGTVEIEERLFPVKVRYSEEGDPVFNQFSDAVIDFTAKKTVELIEQGKKGDILIFMPGVDEINKTIDKIEKLFDEKGIGDFEVLPLHAQMTLEDQNRALHKRDKRRIIVATNVAETSVTVPGIKVVIDPGFIKQKEYDPQTGIESLVIRKHSKSGCRQRGGRSGRVEDGECYRLFTKSDFDSRDEYTKPEILRSNLAHLILTMKKLGIDDPVNFDFPDNPGEKAIRKAIETLTLLGALDEEEKLTRDGKLMAELPLDPHLSKMLIEADRGEVLNSAVTIASVMGARNIFNRPKGLEEEADLAHEQFKNSSSDFISILNIWKEFENNYWSNTAREWAKKNFLNIRALLEAKDIRKQLTAIMEKRTKVKDYVYDDEIPLAIGKSVTSSHLDNLIIKHPMSLDQNIWKNKGYFRIANTKENIYVHPSSGVSEGPQLLTCSKIVETTRTFARNCQVVKPEWLSEVAPHLFFEVPESIRYDSLLDQVISVSVVYFKNGSKISEYLKPVRGTVAAEQFANALALGNIKGISQIDSNAEYIKLLQSVGTNVNVDELKNFYLGKIGDISSASELKEAIEEGKIDIRFKPAGYKSATKIVETHQKLEAELEAKEEGRFEQIRKFMENRELATIKTMAQVTKKPTEDLFEELKNDKVKEKPRKLALIRAELIKRGFSNFKTLGMNEHELEATLNQLENATYEVKTYYGKVLEIEVLILSIKKAVWVNSMREHQLVKEYIGPDDSTNLDLFSEELFREIGHLERVPLVSEQEELIEKVVSQI